MLPGIGKPLFKNLQKIIIKFYDLLSISLFDFRKIKKFANSSYIKVTTPGFAGLVDDSNIIYYVSFSCYLVFLIFEYSNLIAS